MGKIGGTLLDIVGAVAGFIFLGPIGPLIGLSVSSQIKSVFGGTPTPQTEPASSQARNPTQPRTYIRGRRRSYGTLTFFDTSSTGAACDVISFNDGRGTVVAVYLNDDLVTLVGNVVQPLADERYGGSKVHVGFTSGAPTETAFSEVVGLYPGIWTTGHRGDGVLSGYLVKYPTSNDDFLKVYPQGDNIALSAVIDSSGLYDPRLTGQNWADDTTWTGPFDNPILILLWYRVIVRGEDYATRIAPVISYWIAAANLCDSPRALKAGGTEKLYRAWLMWDSTAKPHEVEAEILKTCDGWISDTVDGRLIVFAGQVYPPTITLTTDQIVGYEVQSFVYDEDRLNEIVVSYVSAPNDYNTVEASSWRDDDDIATRGRINSTSFSPQAPSHAQGQYLARRFAVRQNAPFRGTVSTTFGGRDVIGHRYIHLTIIEAGAPFFDGIAEITACERNPQTGGANFTWVSADAAVDNWIAAVDEGDPAPVGELTPLEPLETPTILTADQIFYDYGAQIDLSVSGPARDDLTWFVRWRVSTDVAWNTSSTTDLDPGVPVALITPIVPLNVDVDVQVAYQIGDGRTSSWSATETVDTTAP
jgi:hypothetical protein